MTNDFHTDASRSKRYASAGRLLLLVAAITAFNIGKGWALWSTVGMTLFGLAMVGFSIVVRSTWGDRLELSPDTITVYKQGAKQCISVSDITSLTVKANSIALLWQDAGKKKFIVLGGERFSDSTWARLSSAMNALPKPPVA